MLLSMKNKAELSIFFLVFGSWAVFEVFLNASVKDFSSTLLAFWCLWGPILESCWCNFRVLGRPGAPKGTKIEKVRFPGGF